MARMSASSDGKLSLMSWKEEKRRTSKDTITQWDPILAFCLPVILAPIFLDVLSPLCKLTSPWKSVWHYLFQQAIGVVDTEHTQSNTVCHTCTGPRRHKPSLWLSITLIPCNLETKTNEPSLSHLPAVKQALQRRPPPLHSPGPRQRHVSPRHTEDDETLKQKEEWNGTKWKL